MPQQARQQFLDVVVEAHAREVVRAIKLLVDQGHGGDAAAAFAKALQGHGVVDALFLEIEQAGDDLEVILDAVVDFLEQDVLFPQRLAEFLLRAHACRDVPVHAAVALERAGFVVPGHGARQDAALVAVARGAPGREVADGRTGGLGLGKRRPERVLLARGQEIEGGFAEQRARFVAQRPGDLLADVDVAVLVVGFEDPVGHARGDVPHAFLALAQRGQGLLPRGVVGGEQARHGIEVLGYLGDAGLAVGQAGAGGEVPLADAAGGIGQAVQTLGDDRTAEEPGHAQGEQGRGRQEEQVARQGLARRAEDRGFGQADHEIHVGRLVRAKREPLEGVEALEAVGARQQHHALVFGARGDGFPHLLPDGSARGVGGRFGAVVQADALVVGDAEDRASGHEHPVEGVVEMRQLDGGDEHSGDLPVFVPERQGVGKGGIVSRAADDVFARAEAPGGHGVDDVLAVGEIDAAKGKAGGEDVAVAVHGQDVDVEGIVVEQGGEQRAAGGRVHAPDLGHGGQGGEQKARALGDAGLGLGHGRRGAPGFHGGVGDEVAALLHAVVDLEGQGRQDGQQGQEHESRPDGERLGKASHMPLPP